MKLPQFTTVQILYFITNFCEPDFDNIYSWPVVHVESVFGVMGFGDGPAPNISVGDGKDSHAFCVLWQCSPQTTVHTRYLSMLGLSDL